MHESWTKARNAYNYPVNLADFADAGDYDGWFESNIDGDLRSTRAFQDRFRENAPHHLEAWYEVVYWKYYFISNNAKRDKGTQDRIRYIDRPTISKKGARITLEKACAQELWTLCRKYMESGCMWEFLEFQKKIVRGSGIAVAATFPAFLDPTRFPMVDKHVADWVRKNGKQHGFPALSRVPAAGKSIETNDWDFVESWIKWCRFTARKLTELTGNDWSAREVEMAVFTAQRNRWSLNPLFG